MSAYAGGPRPACADRDPEIFFPPSEVGKPGPKAKRDLRVEQAQVICQSCPVRDAGLDGAISRNERHGVWGGLTTPERDDKARERGLDPGRWSVKPDPKPANVDPQAVAHMTAKGYNAREIALLLNCDQRSVARARTALRDSHTPRPVA